MNKKQKIAEMIDNNGFIVCIILNILFNIKWLIPVIISLVLYFVIGLPIIIFWILLIIWILYILIIVIGNILLSVLINLPTKREREKIKIQNIKYGNKK